MLSLCLDVPIGSSTLSREPVEGIDEPVVDADLSTNTMYYAEFDCKELPEEGYMQLELIGKNEGQLYADLKFVIKVSLLRFPKLLCDDTFSLSDPLRISKPNNFFRFPTMNLIK